MNNRRTSMIAGVLAILALAGVAAVASSGITAAPGSNGIVAGYVGKEVRVYLRGDDKLRNRDRIIYKDGKLDSLHQLIESEGVEVLVRVIGADEGGLLLGDSGSEFFPKQSATYVPYSSILGIRLAN
jgi:hypothetical protein